MTPSKKLNRFRKHNFSFSSLYSLWRPYYLLLNSNHQSIVSFLVFCITKSHFFQRNKIDFRCLVVSSWLDPCRLYNNKDVIRIAEQSMLHRSDILLTIKFDESLWFIFKLKSEHRAEPSNYRLKILFILGVNKWVQKGQTSKVKHRNILKS